MRIRWRDFSKGVYASGSREAVPPGFARRLKGFAGSISGDYLRLRYRHAGRLLTEGTQAVHSIGRHAGRLYYGFGQGFGFGNPATGESAATVGTTMHAHLSKFLDGSRLTFLTGKPVAGKGLNDFLYCCGGGLVFKTRAGATGFSRWGLPAPTEPMTGAETGLKAGESFYRPSLFDFDSTDGWTPTNMTLARSPDVFGGSPSGSNYSLQMTVGGDEVGKAIKTFSPMANFSQFGTGFASVDQDWIVLDMKVVNIANLDTIQLLFYNDPSGNNQSALTFTVVADDPLQRDLTSGAKGLGDITEIAADETGFIENAPVASGGTSEDLVERMAIIKLIGTDGTWTRLKIPKSAFAYSLPTTIGLISAWSQITAFEVIVTTNKNGYNGGGCVVRINNGAMIGGVGMQGHYKYCYTLKDPQTFVRSNPSPICEFDVIGRSGGRLQVPISPTYDPEPAVAQRVNLPLSASGSQMIREIWRTFGNGNVFFKLCELTANIGTSNLRTTTVDDQVADWKGLADKTHDPSLYIQNVFFARGVLGSEVLTFDNIAPGHEFRDAFGPAHGRMWWTRNTATTGDFLGGAGRVYYSPAGRIESVAGFLDVAGQSTDAMQKGVIWNGVYVFSQRRCFEILGVDEPFQAREILGVPGTLWPHTVVPSPYGIIYEATDGIRVFDGSGSQLLPLPPVEVFFRRDTNARSEAGLNAYETNLNHYACLYQDEYRWSDGTTGLAFNLRTGAWRVMDAPPASWFADQVNGECFAGRSTGGIQSWEFGSIGGDYVSVPATATDISYEFETPAVIVDGRSTFLVQRVYLDVAVPAGETMTAELTILDQPGVGPIVRSLGTVNGAGFRSLVEFNVACQHFGVAAVRLSGSAPTGELQIFGVEMDVHIPEEPGFGT